MLFLVALFVLVPIAEIYVIIQVGQEIGALWTVLILIADSLLGAALLNRQGRRAWAQFQSTLAAGHMPHRELLDGVLIVIGGAFLLTPGFLTDAFGLLLLIPPSRAAFRRLLARMVVRRSGLGWVRFGGGAARSAPVARPTARPVPPAPPPPLPPAPPDPTDSPPR